MPACWSRWTCEGTADERAVSEVVGYLLVFAILSMILILSMVAFKEIHDRAEVTVVTVEAESVAQRVASAVVNAALFAEQHASTEITFMQPLDLPTQLEGHSYVVHLDAAAGATPAQVRIVIAALALETTAPLFAADASVDVNICTDQSPGGPVTVQYDSADPCILLEATS